MSALTMNLRQLSFSMVLMISVGKQLVQMRPEVPPDMCTHYSRFSSIAELSFKRGINHIFMASNGFYWILREREPPLSSNCRGRLPQGFNGDAAFFREWRRCENKTQPNTVPAEPTEPTLWQVPPSMSQVTIMRQNQKLIILRVTAYSSNCGGRQR